MGSKLITQVIPAPDELDYVSGFQGLAQLNLEMQRLGNTAARWVKKAIFEMEVGNYDASLAACDQALRIHPGMLEAHYQKAVSLILLALVKAELREAQAGCEQPKLSVRELIQESELSLQAVIDGNDGDKEALEDLEAVRHILSLTDDAEMLEELHAPIG